MLHAWQLTTLPCASASCSEKTGTGTLEVTTEFGNIIDVARIMRDPGLAQNLRQNRSAELQRELYHMLWEQVQEVAEQHDLGLLNVGQEGDDEAEIKRKQMEKGSR
jgi:hypothetical protein